MESTWRQISAMEWQARNDLQKFREMSDSEYTPDEVSDAPIVRRGLLGAIIGDIVGSIYEYDNIKTKDFPLFGDGVFRTDDTVLTLAVAEGIVSGGTEADFLAAIQKYGKRYPNEDYGMRFRDWLRSGNPQPYNSYGNGSAMRVSACGWYAMSLEEAEELARRSAIVTHSHPEGIKGAQAVAAAIYLCRELKSKKEIKRYIEETYGYKLSRSLDEIRPSYSFDETCQGTVPEAIIAFLESTDFVDAIRNAVSLGGDTDTLAAITGSIAEAMYGISRTMADKALTYLDEFLLEGYYAWRKAMVARKQNDLDT